MTGPTAGSRPCLSFYSLSELCKRPKPMESKYWMGSMPPIKIAPSMMNADFAHLADDVAVLEECGVETLHVDVGDGHFVPNLMLGPRFVEVLREITDLHIDCHLMVTDPQKYAPVFIKAGANLVFFHIEVVPQPMSLIESVKNLGAKVGIALKPATPASSIADCVRELDAVMAMTVVPGFSGQKFMQEGCERIPEIRRNAAPELDVLVDGGINTETAPIAVRYGANVLAAASAVFPREKSIPEAVKALREAGNSVLD